ncbi:hypothetical protein ACFPTR_07090 [Aliibacillus thermotolerans]|uniref:Uncharacterized protein n=1 Tax=Aliibacillus thermotolerans TaxID=1834418 RepID=A0ABW0U7S2_9BACI|nr:hypothetical protein [Aliibacillus thermotolerans]MDA3130311.1 hypothetical protein [Aliibacillus thermotolerans]
MKKIYFGFLPSMLSISLVGCSEATNNDEVKHEEASGIDHHDELPYEWAATYELEEGTYTLQFKENEAGDESFKIAFVIEDSNIDDLEHHVAHIMEEDVALEETDHFEAKHEYANNLKLNKEGETVYTFTISKSGHYRIFTEHHPDEFAMEILAEAGVAIDGVNAKEYEGHAHDHEHEHDEEEHHL